MWQWSGQYGRPVSFGSSQKRKALVPGSPIGQQQPSERRLVDTDRMTGLSEGGAGLIGAVGRELGAAACCRQVSAGRLGPRVRRGLGAPDAPLRLIGDGRAGRCKRCAFPTIAFLLKPNLRPISAVLWPSDQSERRRAMVVSVHSDSELVPSTVASYSVCLWAARRAGRCCRSGQLGPVLFPKAPAGICQAAGRTSTGSAQAWLSARRASPGWAISA